MIYFHNTHHYSILVIVVLLLVVICCDRSRATTAAGDSYSSSNKDGARGSGKALLLLRLWLPVRDSVVPVFDKIYFRAAAVATTTGFGFLSFFVVVT